jgi:serine/threonine protein kinase
MSPASWNQINDALISVLEREASERAAIIKEACGSDEGLRQEIESLLAFHEQAGDFLEEPIIGEAARLLAKNQAHLLEDQLHLAVGQRINHYKVLSLLGVGGMGEVYLARDTKLGRQAAIKLLPSRFTEIRDRLHRFQQEARAASALNHPNIITIYEVGEFDSAQYMAMEFIDGETLLQHIKDSRSQADRRESYETGTGMKLSEVLDISIQLASALGAAHSAKIVHRDIKPENIMVRRDGYIKVLDFGVAKLTERFPEGRYADDESSVRDRISTKPGEVIGTPSYMSPEQVRGLAVDALTDIWSAGVVLYEMIAGLRPFEGLTTSDVIALILQKEPLPLGLYARGVPAELERIVAKALRKKKDERYQDIKDLAIDLKNLKQQLEFEAKLDRALIPEESRERMEASRSNQQESDREATVFVVDDDESIRESLSSLIRSVGLRVETFASAQDFLQSRGEDVPGCLVLDVRLPGLSGLDLQRQLAGANSHTPIIFITGHGDIPMTVRAMKAGAVEFLTKPFRDQDLLDAIHQALDRDRYGSDLRVGLGEQAFSAAITEGRALGLKHSIPVAVEESRDTGSQESDEQQRDRHQNNSNAAVSRRRHQCF